MEREKDQIEEKKDQIEEKIWRTSDGDAIFSGSMKIPQKYPISTEKRVNLPNK